MKRQSSIRLAILAAWISLILPGVGIPAAPNQAPAGKPPEVAKPNELLIDSERHKGAQVTFHNGGTMQVRVNLGKTLVKLGPGEQKTIPFPAAAANPVTLKVSVLAADGKEWRRRSIVAFPRGWKANVPLVDQ